MIKNVLALNSLYSNNIEIGIDKKEKPKTITYYNHTKYGVDVVDQMAIQCSTKSASRRWPLQAFFNILDMVGINAWILYKEVTGCQISGQTFLLQLAEELRQDHLTKGRTISTETNQRYNTSIK